jgi:hypothetical protein
MSQVDRQEYKRLRAQYRRQVKAEVAIRRAEDRRIVRRVYLILSALTIVEVGLAVAICVR